MKSLPRPMPDDPDVVRDLVRAADAGDREARERLALWCQPRVRRLVYMSCGGDDVVEDLVQVAMARIFERLSTFRGEARFATWIDRLTLNVVRYHFRRKRWRLFVSYDEAAARHQPPVFGSTETSAEQTRAIRRLATHLSRIKPARRLPLVLVLLHGYSVPEVAIILDVRFETAKKRIHRARRELVELLRKDAYFQALSRELGR